MFKTIHTPETQHVGGKAGNHPCTVLSTLFQKGDEVGWNVPFWLKKSHGWLKKPRFMRLLLVLTDLVSDAIINIIRRDLSI